MIGVMAIMQIKDGAGPAFQELFAELAHAVRANEPGCVLYSMGAKRGVPNAYVTIERFVDAAAVEAHKMKPYLIEARPKIAALLACRPEIIYLDLLE